MNIRIFYQYIWCICILVPGLSAVVLFNLRAADSNEFKEGNISALPICAEMTERELEESSLCDRASLRFQTLAVAEFNPVAALRGLLQTSTSGGVLCVLLGLGVSLVTFFLLFRKFERQHAELRKHCSQLEDLVQSRSTELARSNMRLQQEIDERQQAEAASRTSHSALERRVDELNVLNHITQILVSTLDLPTMLNGVALELMDIFRASSTGIALLSEDKKQLIIFEDYALMDGASGMHGEKILVEAYPAFQQLQKDLKPIVVHDARNNPLTAPGHELIRSLGIHHMMLIPLISQGEVLGTIGIDSDLADRRFTEEEATLAETIAGHIATAIKHVRLFDEEQQQRRLAESLREVTSVLNRSLDLDTVIGKILEQLKQVLQYDSAGVLLRDGNELVVSAGVGIADSTVGNRLSLDTEKLGANVFNSRQTSIVEDVQDNENWESWPEGNSIHGWIGTPLLLGDVPLGILTVDSFQVDAYKQRDAEILQAFANQAAVAIENARLFKQEQRQREIAESLRATTTAVNSSLDRGDVLTKILEQLQRVIQYDAAAIFLREHDELVLSGGRFVNRSFIGRSFPLSENSPETQVFTQRTPQVIDDVTKNPYWGAWEGHRIRSWIGVPLFMGEQVLGILTVDNYSPSAYDKEDAVLLQDFANQVSISIHNAQLYQEIRRENKFFETLMMNSPVATILVDPENRVHSWNPAAERLFGYTQVEATQQDIDSLIAAQGVREEALEFSRRIQQGIPIRAIARRCRKDGRLVDVEIFAVPVRVEERIVSFMALYHDISDLQQARKEAEAANRAKSVFLANMSHELRTPLTAILGFSELLSQSRSLPAEEQDYLQTIHRNGEHLLLLLNNLLDLARLETGDIILEDRMFNLHRLLEELKYLLSLRLDNTQIQLSFQRDPDVPEFVRTDEIKLHQVLLNVLRDILKFTTKGQVVLKIRFETQEEVPGSAIRQSYVFFEIGSSSEIEREENDDFLPVSRQFVRLIGGEVNISSMPEGFSVHNGQEARHGVLFSFAIPVGLAPDSERDSDAEIQAQERSSRSDVQPAESESRQIHAESATALPRDVLERLEYAVITADIARVKSLLNEIRSYNSEFAESLNQAIEHFEYAQILEALQEIKEKI